MIKIAIYILFFYLVFIVLIYAKQFDKCNVNSDFGVMGLCYKLIADEKICINRGNYQDFCFGFIHRRKGTPQFFCQNSLCECNDNYFFVRKLNFNAPSKFIF